MTQPYTQHDLPLTLGADFLSISRDGQVLVTGAFDNVRVWSMAALEQTRVLSAPEMNLNAVAVSPDGRTVAAADWEGFRVLVWDAASGRLRGNLRGHTDMPLSVAFTPDGQTLVTGGRDATVRVWDVASGRQRLLLRGHTRPVMGVAVSPEGSALASASADGTLRLWSLAGGQLLWERSLEPLSLRHVQFSPDGRRLAVVGDNFTYDSEGGSFQRLAGWAEVQILDVARGEEQGVPFVSACEVASLTFTQPDSLVVGDWEGQLTLLHADTGQEMGQHTVEGPYGPSRINAVAWNAAANVLVVAHVEGVALLQPPGTVPAVLASTAAGESQLFMQHHAEVGRLTLGQEGKLLAIGGNDGYVGVWSPARGEPLREYRAQGSVAGLAVDEVRGQVFASLWSKEVGENRLRRWNLLDDAPPLEVGGFPAGVGALALSADGRWLALALRSGGVQVRSRSGALPVVGTVSLPAGASDLAFSPDGALLAIVTDVQDPRALIYDVTSQRTVRSWPMRGLSGVQSWFHAVRWLDDRRVVTGEASGAVRVLNGATGDEEARFEGHADSAFAVAGVTGQGQVLSGSWDGTALLWDLAARTEQSRWSVSDHVLAVATHPDAGMFVADRGGRVSRLQ